MKPLCIYHSADLDGKCSAAIVRRAFEGEVELFGWNYGDPVPALYGRDVIMVDVSFQPFERMIEATKQVSSLLWIDHHKSAIEEAEAAGFGNMTTQNGQQVFGVWETGRAACELAWEWFFGTLQHTRPALRIPKAVRLLGRYDVWDHTDPETLPFQYGCRRGKWNADPAEAFWGYLLGRDGGQYVHPIISEGKLLLSYQEEQNEKMIKARGFVTEVGAMRVVACNTGLTNSQLFDSVWDPEKYDAMMTFQWTPKGFWTVSLYSTKDNVDVGKFAKHRGGGGHKGAAGFQCRLLPFELTSVRPE